MMFHAASFFAGRKSGSLSEGSREAWKPGRPMGILVRSLTLAARFTRFQTSRLPGFLASFPRPSLSHPLQQRLHSRSEGHRRIRLEMQLWNTEGSQAFRQGSPKKASGMLQRRKRLLGIAAARQADAHLGVALVRRCDHFAYRDIAHTRVRHFVGYQFR